MAYHVHNSKNARKAAAGLKEEGYRRIGKFRSVDAAESALRKRKKVGQILVGTHRISAWAKK